MCQDGRKRLGAHADSHCFVSSRWPEKGVMGSGSRVAELTGFPPEECPGVDRDPSACCPPTPPPGCVCVVVKAGGVLPSECRDLQDQQGKQKPH